MAKILDAANRRRDNAHFRTRETCLRVSPLRVKRWEMIFIWGSRARTFEKETGNFHCPACQGNRQYTRHVVTKYFTAYFIPLFPIHSLGEYFQCRTCFRQFDIASLQQETADSHYVGAVRSDLQQGTSVQNAMAKLLNSGIDGASAQRMVSMAAGDRHATCRQCQHSYLPGVPQCSNCGTILS